MRHAELRHLASLGMSSINGRWRESSFLAASHEGPSSMQSMLPQHTLWTPNIAWYFCFEAPFISCQLFIEANHSRSSGLTCVAWCEGSSGLFYFSGCRTMATDHLSRLLPSSRCSAWRLTGVRLEFIYLPFCTIFCTSLPAHFRRWTIP